MSAGARITLYGLLLAVLFVGSALLADALVPAAWVEGWSGAPGAGH